MQQEPTKKIWSQSWQRYAASVQYKGSRYYGLQNQNKLPTIAAAVEQAITRIADHAIRIQYAGRTDKGVHAISQIIHFDSCSKRNRHNWLSGINRYLPDDISLDWIKPVNQSFHARFSALTRRYIYLLYSTPIRPGLSHQMATWTHKTLKVTDMHQAAQYLKGEHNFTSFRSQACQAKTAIRTIHSIKVHQNNKLITIEVTANAFLHHMVRNIVGSLLKIGENHKPINWIQQVLTARDRTQAGATAPPEGLYLAQVTYPDSFKLPDPPDTIGL